MDPIRVLIVDNNETVLNIVKRFLCEEVQHGVVVAGIADGDAEGLAEAHSLQPHVVLVDIDRERGKGLAILRQLRLLLPSAGILGITLQDPGLLQSYRRLAIANGADDLILKDTLTTELVPAVHRLVQTHRGSTA